MEDENVTREFIFEYYSTKENETNIKFTIPINEGGICRTDLFSAFIKFLKANGFVIDKDNLIEAVEGEFYE